MAEKKRTRTLPADVGGHEGGPYGGTNVKAGQPPAKDPNAPKLVQATPPSYGAEKATGHTAGRSKPFMRSPAVDGKG